MPSAAKKLVIVSNDEPETEAVALEAVTQETVIQEVVFQEVVTQEFVSEDAADEAAEEIAVQETAEETAEEIAEEARIQEPAEEEAPAEDMAADEPQAVETVSVEGASVEAVADEAADGEPVSRGDELRLLEALLFAASEPLDEPTLVRALPDGVDVKASLAALQAEYATRGVNLVRVGKKWTFRTASDLSWLLTKETVEQRKLSRAAIETLAIIAYHQPVTRAEIEEVRGVATAAGTLDVLLKTGWIRPRGRRKVPGRPITYGTNEAFLSHFGLEEVTDLPGLDELKGSGLLEGSMPAGFSVPMPSDDTTLRDDEDPLEPGDLDLGLAPAPEAEATAEPGKGSDEN